MLVAFALFAAAPGRFALVDRREIRLAGNTIRLGNVITVVGPGKPLDAGLASRTVGRLPPNRTRWLVSRRALAGLVRRAIPGIALVGVTGRADVVLSRTPSPDVMRDIGNCYVTRTALAAGSQIDHAAIAKGPCTRVPSGRIRFDHGAGLLRANVALDAGTALGRIIVPTSAPVRTGDRLTLISTAGPVRIERPVTALQPGRAGRRVFVRDDAGQVLATKFAPAVGGGE